MKSFKYIGSQAHNSTILVGEDGNKTTEDIRLAPGDTAILPEDHPVIQSLIAGGLLQEIKTTTTSTNKKPA